MKSIGASAYIETSALLGDSVHDVFYTATKSTFKKTTKNNKIYIKKRK